jgi:hypothetical protein
LGAGALVRIIIAHPAMKMDWEKYMFSLNQLDIRHTHASQIYT